MQLARANFRVVTMSDWARQVSARCAMAGCIALIAINSPVVAGDEPAKTDWVEEEFLAALGVDSSAAAESNANERAIVEAVPEITAATDGDEQLDAPTENESAPPSGHQIWLISSRAIKSCGDLNVAAERLRYWRHECGNGWIPASQEEFLAADDPAMPTTFYVHGNRVDADYAREGGLDAYRAYVRKSDVPTRFVIWSWPASPGGRPVEHFRIKADTSEIHSYYLAWLLDRMEPSVPVHLAGYSYGARFITGSLHYLGGGVLMGRALDERVHPNRSPMRASLLAAALDNDWLIPGRRHGQALSQIDRLFITKNQLDPVLHYYPIVLRDRSSTAIGVSGFAGLSRIGAERAKVEQLNVSRAIGKHHTVDLYWEANCVTAVMMGLTVDGSQPAEVDSAAAD